MCKSLVTHKAKLQNASDSNDFVRIASTARARDDCEQVADMLEFGLTESDDDDDADVSMLVSNITNSRFRLAYKSIHDPNFWACADEFLQLNYPVLSAIKALSSDSALLSDACMAFLTTDAKIQHITAEEYPHLLGSASVTQLIQLWEHRMRRGQIDEHYAALFLDPRKHVREFVQADEAILGCTEQDNFGNTGMIQRARQGILRYAEQDVRADDPVVKAKVAAGMDMKDAQELWLEVQLRAFVGVHPKVGFKQLSIDADALRKCVGSEFSLLFWSDRAPPVLALRRVAMRLFSAKPTSVPVERCWSVFGDVLSAKRRCMHKGRLARLVHARANMHLLECDSLELGAETDASAFLSVYEAVGDMDEEEDAARVFAAKALQEDDLHVHDDDAEEESISSLADTDNGALDIDDECL
jgi:hypothetical protein